MMRSECKRLLIMIMTMTMMTLGDAVVHDIIIYI